MDARLQVRRVLIITLVLNIAVAVGKILVGALTGAVSITADGFHSLMDGSSNLIGLGANAIAGKPADEDHPYGHRRFETVAALGVGVLLLLTAYEIVTSAIERLTSGESPEISPLAFVVLIATLGVNLFVSRYERAVGKRLNSELLIADAANTGADVFVTLSVLVSMVLVSLFNWTWADPVAEMAGVRPLGIAPLRRTVAQLRMAPAPPADLPLVLDIDERFYFKPESGRLWLSPHDETPSLPCDAAPEEVDVATAIARFEEVANWRVERVEHKWAGLRSFAPDRLPVYGFDRREPGFFWFAGQGGFGIQTAPAAARLAAALLLGEVDGAVDPAPYSPSRF